MKTTTLLLAWALSCSGERQTSDPTGSSPPEAHVLSPSNAANVAEVSPPGPPEPPHSAAIASTAPSTPASQPVDVDQVRALGIATEFFSQRGEAAGYDLASGRVTDGGEEWDVWFPDREGRQVAPSEALVKVDKTTGAPRRQPLR